MIDRGKYSVVFMGTPDFAKASLESLVKSGYNVKLVVTNPDSKSGRGMSIKFSPVKEYALDNNIEVYQPEKLRNNLEAIDKIKSVNPDFIVTAAYGKILPKEILDVPRFGPINVHGSLLPKYRGSAPVQWAIINGEKKTGITTMFMDEGMDTGDMLLKEETLIEEDDNLETVFNRLSVIGAKLIVETLDKIIASEVVRIKQDESKATTAPMIKREMTKMDFNNSATKIVSFVKGLTPFYGGYMEDTSGNIYKVYGAKIGDITLRNISNKVGHLAYKTKDRLGINCSLNGEEVVEILVIQAPSSKKMDIKSFLAGNKLKDDVAFV